MAGVKAESSIGCRFLGKESRCGYHTVGEFKKLQKEYVLTGEAKTNSKLSPADRQEARVVWDDVRGDMVKMMRRKYPTQLPSNEKDGKCKGGNLSECTCFQMPGKGCLLWLSKT